MMESFVKKIDIFASVDTLTKQELMFVASELQKQVKCYEETFLTREEVKERYKKSLSWVDKKRAKGVLKPIQFEKGLREGVLFPLSRLVEREQQLMEEI